jgi:MFS family permease
MQGNPQESCVPAPPRAVQRWALSPAATTAFSFVGAALVAASSSAVTPLYHLYQQSMHLTPLMITLVFAVYALSLLAALLTVGGLSDYVGRRPVILSGLLLNALAMILFFCATNVGQLILARAVQGLCVGTTTTTLGATILDADAKRGPLLNSVSAFLGLTAGALGSTALVTFAPDPLHLIYEVLFALTALMMVLLFVMPETVSRKAGALASLQPRVRVPRQSRAALLLVTPATIATWAFGGFYLSLMPTVVATILGVRAPWVGGIVVATLLLFATLTAGALRQWGARLLLVLGTGALSLGAVVSLLGIWHHSVAALITGAVIAGFGFGASFSGSLRAVLPTAKAHQRAGLLAAFYVLSYLAFSLPALVAGASVPLIGLQTVAYVYGAVVIVLAIISMIASLHSER